jgi:glutamyl/glutaminyl-tRNA synthetase
MKANQGLRLKYLIEKIGIDKKILIEKSQIPHTTFYRILKKKELLPPNFFELLALLGVSAEDFFNDNINTSELHLHSSVRDLLKEVSIPSKALTEKENEEYIKKMFGKLIEQEVKKCIDNSEDKKLHREEIKEYKEMLRESLEMNKKTKKTRVVA